MGSFNLLSFFCVTKVFMKKIFMTSADKVKTVKIIQDEMKKFHRDNLDKEVTALIGKSSSKVRTEIINIIKNSLESVYKILWQKRDFWKTDIR